MDDGGVTWAIITHLQTLHASLSENGLLVALYDGKLDKAATFDCLCLGLGNHGAIIAF